MRNRTNFRAVLGGHKSQDGGSLEVGSWVRGRGMEEPAPAGFPRALWCKAVRVHLRFSTHVCFKDV